MELVKLKIGYCRLTFFPILKPFAEFEFILYNKYLKRLKDFSLEH